LDMIDKPIEVTDATLMEFVEQRPLVVIDFWHPLCGPCQELALVIDELASEYAGRCSFGKLNVARNNGIDPHLREKYDLRQGVPALLFYKNGQLVDRIDDYHPDEMPSLIRQTISRHL